MQYSKALAVFAAITLAGCGSGGEEQSDSPGPTQTAAASGAGAIDPCSLVTADEVGEAIGDKVVASNPGEGSCTYETVDAQASTVTIEVNQTDAAGQMDIARRTAGALQDIGAEAGREGGAAGRDVEAMLKDSGASPKLGDQAFFGPNAQLSVVKGKTYIAVSPPIMRSRMSGGNPMLSAADRKKIALSIAQKAVTRLP